MREIFLGFITVFNIFEVTLLNSVLSDVIKNILNSLPSKVYFANRLSITITKKSNNELVVIFDYFIIDKLYNLIVFFNILKKYSKIKT